MNRLFVMDPLSPWGHKDINEVTVDILHKGFQVTYCSSEDFISQKYRDVKYITLDKNLFKITSNSFNNRFRLFKALVIMLDYALKENPDYIYFMSYDTIVTSIVFNLCRMKYKSLFSKIFMLNHSNADEVLTSKVKGIAFAGIPKQITQIYYEDFIGAKMSDTFGVQYRVVFHNINDYKLLNNKENEVSQQLRKFFSDDNSIYIISPSSNEIDEEFYNRIIKLDKTGFFAKNKIKLFFKEKRINYKSDHVLFYNKLLSDNEYSFIFYKTYYVLLYYSLSYQYRVSGVYFDAVTFCKPIIYNVNMFFYYQNKEYNIGMPLSKETIETTFDEIPKADYQTLSANMKHVKDGYSEDAILSQFRKAFIK